MAQGALRAGAPDEPVPAEATERVRAMTAAAGLLLIKGVLDQAGYPVDLAAMGLQLLHVAYLTLMDKEHGAKLGTALFWILLGVTTLAGDWLPPISAGVAHGTNHPGTMTETRW